MRIGVDAGGTFTDFVVLHDDGRLESFKLRSNPRDPASVILTGLRQAGAGPTAEVVHGSTVATNALLERKGARTALITTKGFADLVHIGRQNRRELYNLTPLPRRYLIPRELCFEIDERMLFDGTPLRRPSAAAMRRLQGQLAAADVQAVALCLLHAYQNPDHEARIKKKLAGNFYFCASHEIAPEIREYERASTTLLNAYVGPLMDQYLGELERGTPSPLWIMQSNGGVMTVAEARQQAVRTLLSGPAGGVVGATRMAAQSGFTRLLGFDMGGTSTDVCLVDGEPRLTNEGSIDGFPIRVPLLDIQTVGAGGGSLARVDEGGLLRVGPESAGADPGPACYGVGEQATVTDAHVVLGRIVPDQLAGGSILLHPERAAAAIDAIAARLRLSREAAAAGILRVANANMERAIRAVSIERGLDPREFVLVAFGGSGGLHACEMASELRISTVLVPAHAGALSALGMLAADRVRDYATSVLGRAGLLDTFTALEQRALADLPTAALSRRVDLRYAGQSYELTLPWQESGLDEAFHAAHHSTYGYAAAGRNIEAVTIRVRAEVSTGPMPLHPPRREPAQPTVRRIWTGNQWQEAVVYSRLSMPERLNGPALLLDYGSTALVPSGWRASLDAAGNLLLQQL